MRKWTKTLYFGFYLTAIAFATVQRAEATLGESEDSVESDRKAFAAVWHAAVTRNGYTVQEIKSAVNVVREYISPSGVIFAIAWNGVSHPDLTTLLGTYAGEYERALRQTARQKGKRYLQVRANRIVVEKWGHMRKLQGRAYIPSLIPSGVSANEIK